MQLKPLLSIALVIGLVVPVAGASAISAPVAPAVGGEPTAAAATPTATATGSGSGSGTTTTGPGNYTRLYVDDRYRHLELKPGESDSVTVTVESGEDDPVDLSPHLVLPRVGDRPLPGDWVSIDVGDTTLDPDETIEATVSVTVPEGADLGRFRGWIAFTNETITYPGRPSRPVHAATLNLEVWREPTVQILSGQYMHTQLEAGEGYTHQVVIENTGEEPVPVSPELAERNRGRCYGNCPVTVERSWLEIDAPTEIAPGDTATVNVTITPPTDTERGRYDTELDLGITDPARDERDTHWQRIDLNFQVWKQPAEPFETSFAVSEDVTNVTLELSPRSARYQDDGESARFDVAFVSPAGSIVEAKRVRVTDSGFVDLSGERRGPSVGIDEDYAVRNNGQRFVYRIDDPAAGTWTVRIMPHDTIGFGYDIVRNEAGR